MSEVQIQTGVNFRFLEQFKGRYCLLQGGTRSTKTYSALQWLLKEAIANSKEGLVIDVARKFRATHTETTLRDWGTIIDSFGVPYKQNKSELSYLIGKSKITFIGADDAQKIRGASRDILFMNEANEFLYEDYKQFEFRTRRRIILDFNPSMQRHWIYNILKVKSPDEAAIFKSTFRDNPWLDEGIRQSIYDLQVTDPQLWRVYGLGEAAIPEEIVYPDWGLFDQKPDDCEQAIGLDFGFNAPSAAALVSRKERALYIEEIFYRRGMTTADIRDALLECEAYKANKNIAIYADAAEPDRIAELSATGLFNIQKAKKDVAAGIAFVHQHKIYVHSRADNLKKEIESYSWKKHADGTILDEPIKKHDHILDAVRYGCYTPWGQGRSKVAAVQELINPITEMTEGHLNGFFESSRIWSPNMG